MEKLAEILTALAVLFAAAGLALILLRYWISTLSDVIWMSLLRPWPTLAIAAAVAFVVLVLMYAVLPQPAGAPVAMPLLAVVIFVPMATRPLANVAVRKLFHRLDYPFLLEEGSLKLTNLFNLEALQLQTLYTAPRSRAPSDAEE